MSDDLRRLAEEAERIYEGFVSESLNGVVCSIPDEGLEARPHRMWCARCQQRYRDLAELADALRALAAAQGTPQCQACGAKAGDDCQSASGPVDCPGSAVMAQGTPSAGADVERKYRALLWRGHGHDGAALYGDDGEMQCHQCRQWDYRRAPLKELEQQVFDAKIARLAEVERAARKAPGGHPHD